MNDKRVRLEIVILAIASIAASASGLWMLFAR